MSNVHFNSYNFKTDLEFGLKSEKEIKQILPFKVEEPTDRTHDFILFNKYGAQEKIDLKTDRKGWNRVCIELGRFEFRTGYSKSSKLFQCDFIFYHQIQTGKIFIFRPKTLLRSTETFFKSTSSKIEPVFDPNYLTFNLCISNEVATRLSVAVIENFDFSKVRHLFLETNEQPQINEL